MALRDKLETGPRRPPPKTCAVCWVQSWADTDDLEVLDVMLRDVSRYPAGLIADILRDEYDIVIGGDAAGRHRRLHLAKP